MSHKIIVCPDSFKGSLSAEEASAEICKILNERLPECEVVALPLADGGEGTGRLLEKYYPLTFNVPTVNAMGAAVCSPLRMSADKSEAFIESADSIGLPLVAPEDRNIMEASSYGFGLVIKEAIERGARRVYVALGGSATCDGGIGMLRALGWIFKDKKGGILEGKGKDLENIASIDDSELGNSLNEIVFTAICDVENPLYGLNGASFVYGPQKGADPPEVERLDSGLRNLVEAASNSCGINKETAMANGAGAAGGLGFAMKTFLNAKLLRGVDFILDKTGFNEACEGADLIITGEGRLDSQSFMGKVVGGVLGRARSREIPVIAVAGKVEDTALALNHGLAEVVEIRNPDLPEAENLKKGTAIKNLHKSLDPPTLISKIRQH